MAFLVIGPINRISARFRRPAWLRSCLWGSRVVFVQCNWCFSSTRWAEPGDTIQV
jgi:hypothetical protein